MTITFFKSTKSRTLAASPPTPLQVAQIIDDILTEASRVNPYVEIIFVEKLSGAGQFVINSGAASASETEVCGVYIGDGYGPGVIAISLNFAIHDPKRTAYHELMHSIQNLFTDDEKELLRSALPQDGLITHEERVAYTYEQWREARENAPSAEGVMASLGQPSPK